MLRSFETVAVALAVALAGPAAAQDNSDLFDALKSDKTEEKTPAATPAAAGDAADIDLEERPEGEPATTEVKTDEVEATPVPAASAAAAEGKRAEIQDRIKAVPRKAVLKKGRVELAAFASFSLNDPYWQHFAFSGSAVFYPHDAFGFGVGADWLYAHARTSNLDVVRQSLISVPPVFEKPRLFAHADLYWVPIYGKLSLFNAAIVHFDLYGTAGIGMASAFGERSPVAVNAGLGQRLFVADWLALRIEVRDFMFNDTLDVNGLPRSDVQNYVMVQLGASFFIPPTFEYSYR
jgi:outer membrane beta-barrel protein